MPPQFCQELSVWAGRTTVFILQILRSLYRRSIHAKESKKKAWIYIGKALTFLTLLVLLSPPPTFCLFWGHHQKLSSNSTGSQVTLDCMTPTSEERCSHTNIRAPTGGAGSGNEWSGWIVYQGWDWEQLASSFVPPAIPPWPLLSFATSSQPVEFPTIRKLTKVRQKRCDVEEITSKRQI